MSRPFHAFAIAYLLGGLLVGVSRGGGGDEGGPSASEARSATASARAARAARRAAFVAELVDEGAMRDAAFEIGRFMRDFPDYSGLCPKVPDERNSEEAPPELAESADAPGSALARAVVWFYRGCIAPALGARCVLEPSCSRYFVLASRRHGLLGVPMTADRFVREPAVSAPDRPWVRGTGGLWRHPDPVEDHDWWFGKIWSFP